LKKHATEEEVGSSGKAIQKLGHRRRSLDLEELFLLLAQIGRNRQHKQAASSSFICCTSQPRQHFACASSYVSCLFHTSRQTRFRASWKASAERNQERRCSAIVPCHSHRHCTMAPPPVAEPFLNFTTRKVNKREMNNWELHEYPYSYLVTALNTAARSPPVPNAESGRPLRALLASFGCTPHTPPMRDAEVCAPSRAFRTPIHRAADAPTVSDAEIGLAFGAFWTVRVLAPFSPTWKQAPLM
jgi:hypothetical protein